MRRHGRNRHHNIIAPFSPSTATESTSRSSSTASTIAESHVRNNCEPQVWTNFNPAF